MLKHKISKASKRFHVVAFFKHNKGATLVFKNKEDAMRQVSDWESGVHAGLRAEVYEVLKKRIR